VKKTASILLLSVLAFNWVGYRFVSGFLERKADLAFESKIDREEYSEDNLLQITIPLNAPYLSGNSSGFERYDGEIQVGDIHYRYVKRKIVNGNLVLLCLPNDTRNRFQHARVDFFKLVNDLNHPAQGKEKSSGSYKSFATEYSQEINSWNIISLQPVHQHNSIAETAYITFNLRNVLKQPPRA
jgi:hypothetical protein